MVLSCAAKIFGSKETDKIAASMGSVNLVIFDLYFNAVIILRFCFISTTFSLGLSDYHNGTHYFYSLGLFTIVIVDYLTMHLISNFYMKYVYICATLPKNFLK